MEGLPHLLLRVPLPLHHRHRARRVEVHPGRGAHQAAVPSRHGHGAGDGGDGRLREPRARVHAAGHGAAVRHALRRRQRAGGQPGLLERRRRTRGRDAGRGAEPGAAAVRHAAGRVGAAAVRRQRAHASSSTSNPTGCAPTTCRPDEVVAARSRRRTRSARRATCASATSIPMVPLNSVVQEHQGPRRRADPVDGHADGLRARRRRRSRTARTS